MLPGSKEAWRLLKWNLSLQEAGSCSPLPLYCKFVFRRQVELCLPLSDGTARRFGPRTLLLYCRPVGFEVDPIAVGAVPSDPFPVTRLLVKDCMAPLNAVPLKAISLLESRMIGDPPAPFWIPVPLLLVTLLLRFTSGDAPCA